VMMSLSPLVPDELVDCIASGRDPTLTELFTLAESIWTEGAAERSAFAWGELQPASTDRQFALRAAHLALRGSERR
jgi:hypothetical protein